MIITFSAAQGQGKTTLINDIIKMSEFRTDISVYPTKSARTIIPKYGGDLQKIYSDKNMLCDFQLDVLKLHLDIFNYQYQTKIMLVERSFMDILAFSVINLGRFNDLTDWINGFETICHINQSKIEAAFKIAATLTPTNDGVRPINKLFNDAYDAYLTRLISRYPNSYTIFPDGRIDRVVVFDNYLKEGI